MPYIKKNMQYTEHVTRELKKKDEDGAYGFFGEGVCMC